MAASAPRIFVTGVSGYIGGHTVARIVEQHSEWNIVVLVRNEEQAQVVSARWPELTTVIGDLDQKDLLIDEASKADVVLQIASADHVPGVMTLIEGLSKKKLEPGYFIHVGGTGILLDTSNGYGNPSDKVYHDIADVAEITSFPVKGHIHRNVDAAILAAHEQYKVPTVIVAPPVIYGVGNGPVKKRSIQLPFLIEAILKRGKAFSVLEGQNIWDLIHVDDVADAFILLIEEALKPNGGRVQWGSDGYYFAEAGEFKWASISSEIAKALHSQGLIKSAEVDKLTVEEVSELHPWAPMLWGSNARSRADRLRQVGWVPKAEQVYDSLPAMVAEEVKNYGLQTSKITFDK